MKTSHHKKDSKNIRPINVPGGQLRRSKESLTVEPSFVVGVTDQKALFSSISSSNILRYTKRSLILTAKNTPTD